MAPQLGDSATALKVAIDLSQDDWLNCLKVIQRQSAYRKLRLGLEFDGTMAKRWLESGEHIDQHNWVKETE